MLGTAAYMAPEAMHDPKETGAPADIYALAMTAAFVLHGADLPLTVLRDLDGFLEGLDCCDSVRKALVRATSVDPAERFASAVELAEALELPSEVLQQENDEGEDQASSETSWPPSGSEVDRKEERTRTGGSPRRQVKVRVDDRQPRVESGRDDEALADRSKMTVPTSTSILKWAHETDRDEYGLWAKVDIAGVDVGFRWIAPGRFLMGSAASEEGRGADEGRHEVTMTEGYWLAETPCTQALWEAVTGENPSKFQSAGRPVEQVSWKQCQGFLAAVNGRFPSLRVRLPSEAEWEYACRAGTETAIWTGDPKYPGVNNAPLLDTIAWYAGNSGVDFDLSEGFDSSGWREKQYPHEVSGTREVKLKAANPWGLYDMLGNVWEWCSDRYGTYSDEAQTDPLGPDMGSYRVVRGGSWYGHARFVRAACRDWFAPVERDDDLGFRLARGQEQEEPEAEPVARSSVRVGRGTSPRRRSGSAPAWLKDERWASEGGTDEFGRWASFEIEGVSHRLRWVKPGTFLMGSPETEIGRDEREQPQHEVTLTCGYWLGETPCTQDLWEAVMGENSSHFKGPRRPMEQVSWHDCARFFGRLNERIHELEAGLPTEAQWEYACRAGTATARWTGDVDAVSSAAVEGIAWYRDNAGRETREVGTKAPNPWGFKDLLGNVNEWCWDWGHRYPAKSRVDPTGPEGGSLRVFRGGSWSAPARIVRAASRLWNAPGYRYSNLGFRLSRGPGAPARRSRESKNQGSGSARRGTRRRA